MVDTKKKKKKEKKKKERKESNSKPETVTFFNVITLSSSISSFIKACTSVSSKGGNALVVRQRKVK